MCLILVFMLDPVYKTKLTFPQSHNKYFQIASAVIVVVNRDRRHSGKILCHHQYGNRTYGAGKTVVEGSCLSDWQTILHMS